MTQIITELTMRFDRSSHIKVKLYELSLWYGGRHPLCRQRELSFVKLVARLKIKWNTVYDLCETLLSHGRDRAASVLNI